MEVPRVGGDFISFSCESPNEELQAFMLRAHDAGEALAASVTIPLYALQHRRMKQCGSGVLLQIADKHFILTAAHTFDALNLAKVPLIIYSTVAGEMPIPPFEATRYYPPTIDPVDRADDPFDICVCEIPQETAEGIRRGKRFLRLPDIDPVHSVHHHGWYMVFGYPHDLNPQDPETKAISGNSLAYSTFVYLDERGPLLRHDQEVGIALDYNAETSQNVRPDLRSLPHPRGMSGCGLWRLVAAGSLVSDWKPELVKLIGIQHSLDPAKVVRGTKIRYALQIIYRNYRIRPAEHVVGGE